MAAERFFWGAGFSATPDGMHYEVSAVLIADWKANGAIPRFAATPTVDNPPSFTSGG